MSEIIVPRKDQDIEDEARNYGRTLLSFVWGTDFPESLLSYPDHLMIKSSGPSDFERKVKALSPWAEQAAFVEVDDRFLVAAQLVVPLALTQQKGVRWVEIMEPKSPDSTADFLGAEYTEFYYDNFYKAGLMLKKSRVEAEKRTDNNHRWWHVRMNDKGQELRITDTPLAGIIGRELDDGTARPLINAT